MNTRFICPKCRRTKPGENELAWVECDYCAVRLITMIEWVRKRLRKTKVEK